MTQADDLPPGYLRIFLLSVCSDAIGRLTNDFQPAPGSLNRLQLGVSSTQVSFDLGLAVGNIELSHPRQ